MSKFVLSSSWLDWIIVLMLDPSYNCSNRCFVNGRRPQQSKVKVNSSHDRRASCFFDGQFACSLIHEFGTLVRNTVRFFSAPKKNWLVGLGETIEEWLFPIQEFERGKKWTRCVLKILKLLMDYDIFKYVHGRYLIIDVVNEQAWW